MKFEDWLDESEKEMDKRLARDLPKHKGLIAKNYHDRLIQHFIGFKTFKETRKLVIATWILAIATIILSILTLYFK